MDKVVCCNIPLRGMIQYCINGGENINQVLGNMVYSCNRLVHEVFGYQKLEDDFCDSLVLENSGKEPIGFIRPSYNLFLSRVCYYLGINYEDYEDNDELTKVLNDRITKLRDIKSIFKLKEEFPAVYDDWIKGNEIRRQIDAVPEEFQNKRKRLNDYYYSHALYPKFNTFTERQTKMYSRFVNDREKYKELISSKDFNKYLKEKCDVPKLMLFIVECYLEQLSQEKDEETRDRILNIVLNYINSSYDKRARIITDNGMLSYYDVLVKYIKEKFGKDVHGVGSVDKLLAIIKSNTTIFLGWEILPEGREPVKCGTGNASYRQLKLPSTDVDKLREIGAKRREFYNRTNPSLTAVGLKKYKGYVAYIYENGTVVLDTVYDENRPLRFKDSAIYIINITDLEKLRSLNKRVLKNMPGVKRVIHGGNWESVVEEYINKEVTPEEQKKVSEIIRLLKKRSSYN